MVELGVADLGVLGLLGRLEGGAARGLRRLDRIYAPAPQRPADDEHDDGQNDEDQQHVHYRTRSGAAELTRHARRAALEAAKEAKYAEIRDAELDYRIGKLSEEDWRAQDRALRAEAIEILRRLDAL